MMTSHYTIMAIADSKNVCSECIIEDKLANELKVRDWTFFDHSRNPIAEGSPEVSTTYKRINSITVPIRKTSADCVALPPFQM